MRILSSIFADGLNADTMAHVRWIWATGLIVFLLFILSVVVLRAYIHCTRVLKRQNLTIEQQKRCIELQNRLLQAKKRTLELDQLKAQFEQVRNQLNPHFFFNTLNTLTAMIPVRPEDAIQLTHAFSALFRKVLELKETLLIPLSEELDHVEKYLFIQKSRFPDSLIVESAIDPNTLNGLLPPFALQILLENAIQYNEVSVEKPLKLVIESNDNQIEVRNTLQPRNFKAPYMEVDWQSLKNRYSTLSEEPPQSVIKDGFFIVKLPLIHATHEQMVRNRITEYLTTYYL